MNRPPQILVNSGFVTDQNGVLTEMVIPNNVVTMNAPTIVTTSATAINWLPATTALRVFNGNNITAITDTLFSGYTLLDSVSFNNLVTISKVKKDRGLFFGCTSLEEVHFPKLQTIYEQDYNGSAGTFNGCTSLTSVNMPELVNINATSTGVFGGCTSLVSVNMPKLETIGNGASSGYVAIFKNCTALETLTLPSIKTIAGGGALDRGAFNGCTTLGTVQLGSEGHPVSSIGSYAFGGCTQTGLTITIYTNGGASLAGEPWGATNAVIEYEEA